MQCSLKKCWLHFPERNLCNIWLYPLCHHAVSQPEVSRIEGCKRTKSKKWAPGGTAPQALAPSAQEELWSLLPTAAPASPSLESNTSPAGYLISCSYHVESERLSLAAGAATGDVLVCDLDVPAGSGDAVGLALPAARLHGSHSEVGPLPQWMSISVFALLGDAWVCHYLLAASDVVVDV